MASNQGQIGLKNVRLKPRVPVKLIELSGESWLKGVSYHPNIAIGGLFRSLSNFDPFEKLGVFKATLNPTQRGSGTTTVAGAYNVGFTDGGTSYFYTFGDTSKVYRVNITAGSVADKSAQITGITTIRGAERFKNKVIYANDSTIFSNSIPLVLASQTTIVAGLQTANHIMKIGPDRNLYATNKQYIARITNAAGLSGNSAQYLSFEDDVVTRDIESDGQFLVIAGDTNEVNGSTLGTNRCFVAFWNMKSKDLTQVWEFTDNQIFSIELLENEVIVHGRDNIYTCSVTSPIQVLMPLRGNSNFVLASSPTPGRLIKKGTSVLWGNSGNVYAYGRLTPAMKKIFYQPNSLASGNIVSLFFDGSILWATSDDGKLWQFTSATSQTSVLVVDDIDFKRPYELAFIKAQLLETLTSGQSLAVQILTAGGNRVLDLSDSFDYATFGAKLNHIYYPKPALSSSDAPTFEDATNFTITNTGGVQVKRFEMWGYPIDPTQDLGY